MGHISEASVPKVWVVLAFRPHSLGPLLLCGGSHREVVFHRRIVLDAFVLLGLHLKIQALSDIVLALSVFH